METDYQLKTEIYKCCKSLENFKLMKESIINKIMKD